MTRDIEELITLANDIERRLISDTVQAERERIRGILARIAEHAPDSSIAALANHVAVALSHRTWDGPGNGIAVHRALCAVDRLRLALQNLTGQQSERHRQLADIQGV